MKRPTIARIVLAGAALTIMALPISGAAADTSPQQPNIRTIEVQGNGEARSTPDTALLDIAIETHGPTAEEAASKNAELADKVVKALKEKLGAKGKIWTGGYNLYPDYENRPIPPGPQPSPPKIVGYHAENSISVETGALDLLGTLIDTSIGAGANRVNSLNFSLRDDINARSEAISKASKAAQTQAQALASALSLKLKRIVSATTVGEVRPIPMMNRMMAAPMGAAGGRPETSIQAGEVTVPATVSLVYEIE